jgi:hypothetical protein
VLGQVRDGAGPNERSTNLIDVDVPSFGGSTRSTVELMVGLPSDSPSRSSSGGDGER